MTSQSGGGASGPSYGKQLAYAQITAPFTVVDATGHTVIDGLTVTFTPETGITYCVEFYSDSVEEYSGSTLGDVMVIQVLMDGAVIMLGSIVNGLRGVGGTALLRSSTLTGDGSVHVLTATVQDSTTGSNGAIVDAIPTSPCYIRVVQV